MFSRLLRAGLSSTSPLPVTSSAGEEETERATGCSRVGNVHSGCGVPSDNPPVSGQWDDPVPLPHLRCALAACGESAQSALCDVATADGNRADTTAGVASLASRWRSWTRKEPVLSAHLPSHDNSWLHAAHNVHTVHSTRRVYPVSQAGASKSKAAYEKGGSPAAARAAAVSSRPLSHSAASSAGDGVTSVYRPVSPGSARIDTSSKSITTSPLPDGCVRHKRNAGRGAPSTESARRREGKYTQHREQTSGE